MQLLCSPVKMTLSVLPDLTPPFPSLAVYIHIPFCQSRCTYCAFNTYAGQSDQIGPYMQALQRELVLVAGHNHLAVSTIYFGGGTPSLIPIPALAAPLQTCDRVFSLAPGAEISLEANPGTIDQAYLDQLRRFGVNRLSFGMQSAHESELKLFGRRHRLEDVRVVLKMARAVGFDNINLDLILGIPRQTLGMWRHSLEIAISLTPTHLSLYSLGIENATPLQRWIAQGRLPAPDPDLAADMYEWASERLAAEGFEQYEISNWARPGMACHHNLHVWQNRPYLGIGAGAHGYAARTRYANVSLPAVYIERIQNQKEPLAFPLSAAAETIDTVDDQEAMAETMFLGLRLTQEGIAPDMFRARFGHDVWTVYGRELDALIACGLLENTPAGHIRLTPRGRLLGNHVFAAFVTG